MTDNVMILGYWRTGTNLLISILHKSEQYFDFNEYYSLTGQYVNPSSQSFTESNQYLEYLCEQIKIQKRVLKVNFPHYKLVGENIHNLFKTKVILYRSDLFKVALSRIVAEARQSWSSAVSKNPTQPKFSQIIDTHLFNETLGSIIDHHNTFISKLNTQDVSIVINYENDLLPYLKKDPMNSAGMLKSNNYEILNYDELVDIYQKNVITQEQIQKINDYFESTRTIINNKINGDTTIPPVLLHILNKT